MAKHCNPCGNFFFSFLFNLEFGFGLGLIRCNSETRGLWRLSVKKGFVELKNTRGFVGKLETFLLF